MQTQSHQIEYKHSPRDLIPTVPNEQQPFYTQDPRYFPVKFNIILTLPIKLSKAQVKKKQWPKNLFMLASPRHVNSVRLRQNTGQISTKSKTTRTVRRDSIKRTIRFI